MQCLTAKSNPILLSQAVRFYLDFAKTRKMGQALPIYCFMSLWRDDEPFPLAEVIQMQTLKMQGIMTEFEQCQSDNQKQGLWTIYNAEERKLRTLETLNKTQTQTRTQTGAKK